MPLSKVRNRERMREDDYRVKTGECSACHRVAPIHKHHPDYSKPKETIAVCSSCHKKIHLYAVGKQRTTSKPYINPLLKLQPKPVMRMPSSLEFFYKQPKSYRAVGVDADGNLIYEE